MARTRTSAVGGGDERITDAQLEALAVHSGYERAQARALVEEGEQGREKLRLLGQELADKARLGTAQISSEDKRSRLAAAVTLMDAAQKTRAGAQGEKMDLLKALVGRPDINAPVLAGTLKGSGMPALADALAAQTAKERTAFIQQQVPAMLAAKSDAEREKKLKPAMEAAYPGSFEQGRALAFRGVAPATPTPAPTAPVGEGATDTDRIAAGLLQAAGYGPTGGGGDGGAEPSEYPTLSNAPEPSYVPKGAGSLEGSRYVDLGGGRSRLTTPSGGTIGFNTPQTARRAGLLGGLIGSPVTVPALAAPAGINDLVAPAAVAPTMTGNLAYAGGATPPIDIPLVPPPEVPVIAPTAPPPATSAIPFLGRTVGGFVDKALTPGPPPWVDPAELERQRLIREALAGR